MDCSMSRLPSRTTTETGWRSLAAFNRLNQELNRRFYGPVPEAVSHTPLLIFPSRDTASRQQMYKTSRRTIIRGQHHRRASALSRGKDTRLKSSCPRHDESTVTADDCCSRRLCRRDRSVQVGLLSLLTTVDWLTG